MAQRIIWGFALGFAFIFFAFQSLLWVLLLFGIIQVLAQAEYLNLVPGLKLRMRVQHLVFSTLVWLVASLAALGTVHGGLLGVVIVLTILLYAVPMLQAFETDGDPQRFLLLIRAVLLVTLPLAFVTAVTAWPGEFPYLLLLIGASWGADSGAYFAGKLLGQHQLAPRLSPKKTKEGVIGGLCAAAAIWAAVPWLYQSIASPFDTLAGLPLWLISVIAAGGGALLALIGVAGDLTYSMFKRLAGVKDYGGVIPGHGGILDRFDSMLFVAPVLYLVCLFA